MDDLFNILKKRNQIQSKQDYQNVKHLRLYHYDMEKSLDLGVLPNLESLDCSGNKDSIFPKGSPNLRTLKLSRMPKVDDELLKQFPNLTTLELRDCELKTQSLEYLNLQRLFFSIDGFKELPKLSQSLKFLHCSGKDIEVIPYLENLQNLYAKVPFLKKIESLVDMKNLHSLVTNLMLRFEDLEQLKALNEFSGGIVDKELDIENFSFHKLQIHNSNLRKFKLKSKRIFHLTLAHSPLERLELYTPKLKSFNLGETNLENLHLNDFPALERMYLRKNKLKSVELVNMPHLQTVDLSKNQLASLYLHLDKLSDIKLEANPIEKINIKSPLRKMSLDPDEVKEFLLESTHQVDVILNNAIIESQNIVYKNQGNQYQISKFRLKESSSLSSL